MVKKLLAIFLLSIVGEAFAQYDSEYSSGSGSSTGSIDVLASGGYSQVVIDGDAYTGYNAFLKFLLPFHSGSNLYFGFGARYEAVTSTASNSFNGVSKLVAYNVLGLCVRAGNRSTKVDIITKV